MKFFLLSVLLAFVVCGCGKVDDPDKPISVDIWPIREGNNWTYADTLINNAIGAEPYSYFTVTQAVVKDDTAVLRDGKQFLHIKNFYSKNPLYCSGDKVFYIYDNTLTPIYMAVPTQDNQILSSVQDGGNNKTETVGFTKKYTINGYECWKNEIRNYEGGDLKRVEEIYFKEGIGIIRYVARSKRSSSNIFTEVEKYSLQSYQLK